MKKLRRSYSLHIAVATHDTKPLEPQSKSCISFGETGKSNALFATMVRSHH